MTGARAGVDTLPKYDLPPVVETVMGVQFKRLPKLTTPYIGWYWKSQLDDTWQKALEAPVVDDTFELFGSDRKPIIPRPFSIRETHDRIQLVAADDARMIQIQNTRFIYNWRKRSDAYPSFDVLSREFTKLFDKFQAFCANEEVGKIELNQWELTYLNHIPKGESELWNDASDLPKVFPWLSAPARGVDRQRFESAQCNFTYVIGNNVGRLHISLAPVFIGGDQSREAIRLQLSARGPISSDDGNSLGSSFSDGHFAIVTSFTDLTSDVAHKSWRRKS